MGLRPISRFAGHAVGLDPYIIRQSASLTSLMR